MAFGLRFGPKASDGIRILLRRWAFNGDKKGKRKNCSDVGPNRGNILKFKKKNKKKLIIYNLYYFNLLNKFGLFSVKKIRRFLV
jgi:hypothetical protein